MVRRLIAEGLAARPPEAAGKSVTGTRAEKATNAREHAAGVADGEMEGMDGTADEKTARRMALTEKPAMVAKARAKGRQR